MSEIDIVNLDLMLNVIAETIFFLKQMDQNMTLETGKANGRKGFL